MSKRTRLIPREFSEPAPLTDPQVEALRGVLSGFRELYFTVDDNVPAGPEKEAIVQDLGRLKLRADAAIRHPPRLTLRRFADLLAAFEAEDKMVTMFIMNSVDFADLRADPGFKEVFDPSTTRKDLIRGLMGSAFNASLFVLRTVPVSHVVLVDHTDEDSVGEIGPDWVPSKVRLTAI